MHRLREKGRNPLLLFPEGTRSHSKKLLPFRTGGLKMVFDSEINVLPIRISGTYRLFEEKNLIKPGEVRIEVLPVIEAENYKDQGFGEFLKVIKKCLSEDD
jgi:1-acyl-sn-glycerol-3-phosphate acyltransferase